MSEITNKIGESETLPIGGHKPDEHKGEPHGEHKEKIHGEAGDLKGEKNEKKKFELGRDLDCHPDPEIDLAR
ncbi:hypothetical protein FNV43_RR16124 [Rhamnella rubrinervis]|uniref:Uncharacterized protein n=1 Tax=Rhamnella rubrinervis TaxID=2594499 RepID=A0A8K0E7W7_9ROSA|nr:hypothetical protein FNV43_RR16124 [Rhamnella rubrinervis]